ncbi:sulfate transporter CysZ [Aliikangiella sp. IMCC44632]
MHSNSFSGAQFLSKGFSLIWQPGIRLYVLIPLFINIVLLSFATIYAFNHLNEWYDSLQYSDSSIVQWIVEFLGWLLWPLIVISVIIVVFFSFAFIANWVAAPFNGLLAEAVENHLSKNNHQSVFKFSDFIADIPRLLGREWRKLAYYVPRAIGCLLLFITPLAPIAPFIWFGFNAWMAAVQYIDYPQDNHKIGFNRTLTLLRNNKSGPFGFGSMVMLLTMIPVVNLLVMPAAVAGATALWVKHYRQTELSAHYN